MNNRYKKITDILLAVLFVIGTISLFYNSFLKRFCFYNELNEFKHHAIVIISNLVAITSCVAIILHIKKLHYDD